jgi:hypothetical protein
MEKIVRRAYPVEVSLLMLGFIFLVVCFFTKDIFEISFNYPTPDKTGIMGMFLVGAAVVIALLIIWEELLFPVVLKQNNDTLTVNNHQEKLLIQTCIYLAIPAIFFFIYKNFNISMFHFAVWAGICLIVPIMAKIYSGIINYNDYLKLSPYEIEYKNNEKEGKFQVSEVSYIQVIKDRNNILSKLKLGINNTEIIIDLDEMELDAYYNSIEEFTQRTYNNLLKQS